jgi:hypothetical protein
MLNPAPPTSSGRISMSARDGAPMMRLRYARRLTVRWAPPDEKANMTQLNIEPNMAQFDAFYEELIEAHRDLTPEQSHQMNAKLVLLLANHIGDLDLLKDAMQRAKPR